MAVPLIALAVAGCAQVVRPHVALPVLQLAPSTLGYELAEQQRLVFHFGGERREMVALLEVDSTDVRLAVEVLGQTGVRLHWDGETLEERRASWLPPQVKSARVLDDIQFVLWPLDAIRSVLPTDWHVESGKNERRLVRKGAIWLAARYDGATVTLENVADGYRLEVQSVAAAAAR
ncbi:DUF3261 domain-containing protein [Xanthomonadaceae bacterium XH05]|nr:DUF3261 domain-containing protein [Xanthomonadaceae bacterium XH05]